MQAELASVVTSAVRFLFAPDIQFDELDFSEKVSTHTHNAGCEENFSPFGADDPLSVRPRLQDYLAHKKAPHPVGPPQGPRHRPTVRSYGVAFAYKRGTSVCPYGTGSRGVH